MEVALPTGGSKKHVEEWSRIDRLTGMLEHARVEADHWATNTSNSSHHFGKIVDSRARNLADGSVEQKQQTKQLEVFQAQIPGGSVQVIRSHTKTSSSWHSKQIDGVSKSENRSKISANDNFHDNFNDFKERTCSNMNFNLEKSKAQAAKALGVRRPPSRFRPANAEKPTAMNGELTKSLFDETREVCERVHREMGESLFANDFGLMNGHAGDRVRKESDRGAVGSSKLPPLLLDRSPLKAISKKCTSDENLSSDFVIDEAGSANDGQNDMSASADSAAFSSAIADWKRTSKMRWSLQYPSKSRRYESENENENESENGSVSKTELQRVMEKVLNRRIAVDPPATKVGKPVDSDVRPDDSCSTVFKKPQPARAAKRNSFVTEQTLKETRSKLKHWEKDEDVDDGIDTEVSNRSETVDDSSGKERLMNGTGSLESRSSKIGTNAKSDDWFNRRKSYGFEAVYPQNYISKTAQNVIDSSTDSGICRSSELVSGAKSTKPESSVRLHGGTTVITFSEEQSDSGGNATDSIGTGSNEATSRSSYEPVKITVPSAADINNGYRNAEESSESEGTWSGGPANFRPMKLATDFQPLKSPLTVKNQIENSDHQQSSGGNGPHHERKPKKVGFCKTEVHFAAEPGKINIVETDEKPPPTNLYRRRNRRNSSPDSPITAKRNSGSLPETKFGDYEKTLLTDNIAHHAPDDIIGNSENGNGPGHTDDSMSGQSSTTDNGLAVRISSGTSTSSTAGATTTDIRRASWSVPENRGYSTKINVGHKGATTVVGNMGKPAAAGMQRMRHSICGETASGSLWEVTNTSVPDIRQCQEKLIVRIGQQQEGCCDTEEYIQKPTFCHSFRNSGHHNDDQPSTSFNSPPVPSCQSTTQTSLKSTSLIMDTIRTSKTVTISNGLNNSSTSPAPVAPSTSPFLLPLDTASLNNNITTNNNSNDSNNNNNNNNSSISSISSNNNNDNNNNISNPSYKETETNVRQPIGTSSTNKSKSNDDSCPSSYITEMNRLQQRYFLHKSKVIPQMYRTVPPLNKSQQPQQQMSAYANAKKSHGNSSQNDLPSVLNAFDNLSRQIDKVIVDRPKPEKYSTCDRICKLVEELKILSGVKKSCTIKKSSSKNAAATATAGPTTTVSSQMSLLNEIVKEDDGVISDDSLKADEEVRSYMSAECLESSSDHSSSNQWTDSTSLKFIKPLKIISREEFGGSNHTYLPKVSTKKPVDLLQKPVVRQCKTTAVSINIGRGPFRDVGKHFQPITKPTSTSATISSENNTNFQPVVHKTKVKSQAVDQTANKPYHQTTKKNPSTTILNSSNDKTSAAPTRLKESAAKVIYHNITIMTDAEKGTSDAKHQKIAARSSQQRASSFAAVRKDVESSGSRNDSLSSRKKISAHERSKLFESGRDSWLNIPKEQKLGSSALTRKSKWATGNANTTGSSKSSVCASKDVATVDDRDPTLEELTKAADEIKLVVGGYTDLESSYITSSEDDATTLTKRKHDKRVNNAVPLTTIKEKSIGSTTRTKQANRFPEKISSGYDVAVSTARKPDAKSEDRSKKRQARMLHRACSREMLLQNNKTASSDSENSELESEKQNTSKAKPKFIRKLKVQSKPSKSTITTAIAETSTNRHHSTRSSSSARGSLPTAVSSTGNSTNRIANNNSSSSVCSAGVTEKSTMKKFERSDQPINNSRSQKNTSEMRLRISGAHNKLNDSSARQKKKQSSLICPDIKTYVR